MKIRFLGAAGTVTGSRTLVETNGQRILVDCGLFQGFKNFRLKNWAPFPVDVSSIDAVLLTHAHLDHSGYLPVLVKNGYRGPIYATAATRDLAGILLPDSGFLQEEEARFANRHGYSKHQPALPLYTMLEAQASLRSFRTVPWRKPLMIGNVEVQFFPAGHLFGASTIRISSGAKSLAFSGDVGREIDPVTRRPDFIIGADDLVLESTYGNRIHPRIDAKAALRDVIKQTMSRQGVLLIPSFAVGRAQLVLYYIHQLLAEGAIPPVPVYLDSPMAANANVVFCQHPEESKLAPGMANEVCQTAKVIGSVEESKALNERNEPMIIIAASGMATGGRVLHHLKSRLGDARNTIFFVGYQAGGTRGDLLVKGAQQVKIHGQYWRVHAEVSHLDVMSGHADQTELVQWVASLKHRPRRIFLNHGDFEAADALRLALMERLQIPAFVSEGDQEIDLELN